MTVALDDELVKRAQEYTGIQERSALIRHALMELVQAEAARRLAALAGTMPEIEDIRRRTME
jgi:hypothetical protein